MLRPGARLGSFEVIAPIAKGGMGEVYRARDTKLDRDVAIKVLAEPSQSDQTQRARLDREAKVLASLNHRNIATIFGLEEAEGSLALVMELVDGLTLAERLSAGLVPVREGLLIARQVLEALAAAHTLGVVHRDLKPANIKISSDGTVKVLDFGLARLAPEASSDQSQAVTVAPDLTRAGLLLGTPPYMSPEQIRGEPVDKRTDIWAFGCILYELLAGRPAFTRATIPETFAAVLEHEPPPLPSQVPNLLHKVVGRCLEKDVRRRYQDDGEVLAALELNDAAPPNEPPPTESRRGVLIAAAMIVVVALGAAAFLVRRNANATSTHAASAAAEDAPIRLAVMPFANLTGDAQQDYFSDGLTEELIGELGRLTPQRLRVIARTSVMRYKSSGTPIDQIGRELGVEYVLTGSARREATRVRVTTQLVQARDQTQVWSQTYDRDITSILALQDDVALHVAQGLALTLLPATSRATATLNPAAYDLYLKGRAMFNTGPLAYEEAERWLSEALQKDSNAAATHATLANLWILRGSVGLVKSTDAYAHANTYARRAIELDDRLPDAHVAQGWALMMAHNWLQAEAELKLALQLNPNLVDGHTAYAALLSTLRRFDEADAQAEWAVALDPLNGYVRFNRAVVWFGAGRLPDAIREFRSATSLSPGLLQIHWMLWRALHATRDDHGAYLELETLSRSLRPDSVPRMAEGYASGGYREAMRREAFALEEENRRAPLSVPSFAALVPSYAALVQHDAGNDDRAFAWMEQSLVDGDINLPTLPILAPDLKENPRFRALMQRIGLPY